MYGSVITQEDCDREQRAFLRSLGLKSMDELNAVFERFDYDTEKIEEWYKSRKG